MKRGILISSTLGIIALAAILIVGANGEKQYYQPRTGVDIEEGANGAIEWLHRRQANQITGEIDPADVIAARKQTAAIKSKNQATLHWGEMGPDNIGGRTRAILFDKDDPNIIYAGSVSGGLFKSTNGGSTWKAIDDFKTNLAVVSICQTSDGTIYYGTGEGLYYFTSGRRVAGIIGGGIFKSTDGGNTFHLIPETEPVANIPGADFASVGKLASDPNNPLRLYAATNNGLIVTDDGFKNWTRAFSGGFGRSAATDLLVTQSGKVWVKQGAHLYKSDNGDPGTYVRMTQLSSGNDPDVFAGSASRIRMAVSPQDENYVYAVATEDLNTTRGPTFRDAWKSTDGGNTWTKIGSRSVQLNPHREQGNYNNALAVDPTDKDRILVGGVELWEWSEDNGWLMIASLAHSVTNQLYVHADDHEIKFHPNNPNTIFVGNDGGVFRSTNGGITWSWIVKNYITTQYYNIAVGSNFEVLGGTQDNGTILIDPNAPLPRKGERTPSISFRGRLVDGDGGYAEMSKLDPRISFKAMQYGVIGRSVDGGENYSFVLTDDVDPNLEAGSRIFADFVTPFNLWENRFDPLSEDSIMFVADSSFLSIGFGGGKTEFKGVMPRPQPSARFITDGFVIRAGNAELRSDANGNLVGNGTGSFDSNTGAFTVNFTNPVNLEITAKAAVRYAAGDTITVLSATNNLPVPVNGLPTALEPLDTLMVQDPVQSMFAVGVTARRPPSGAIDQNEIGGIWMTREALSNINEPPQWFHIATLGASGNNRITPTTMTFSPDGDALYVGTNNGVLYRLSNLHEARDSASTSVNNFYVGTSMARSATSVIEKTVIKNFNGRAITDVAIHPDSSDLMIVTLGNYGNSEYIYYADSATFIGDPNYNAELELLPTDLPEMPIYTAIFNYKSGSFKEVYIGTDLGVFATDDITADPSTWRLENAGMANVPVFDLVQQKTVRYDIKGGSDFEGFLYAGTHGRGIFMSNSLSSYISAPEPIAAEVESKPELNIFPNPARDYARVGLQLENRADVTISIRSMTGKLVKSLKLKNVDASVEDIPVNVSGLGSGTYLLTLMEGKKVQTGKLIVVR